MTTTKPPPQAVVIYAKDLARVAAFYEATLALVPLERDTGFVVLGSAGVEVNIVQAPAELAAAITIASPPVLREETPIKPSFAVDSLERVAHAATAAGGGTQPAERAWRWRGQLHLDGHDPEGNIVQFRSRCALTTSTEQANRGDR